MTAYIQQPDMDVHRDAIEAVAAMNLHDRAEYQFQVGMRARPRYSRHSHFDPVAGEWVQFTADELADRAFEGKWRRLLFTLYGVLVLAAGVAVVLAILHGDGVLS